jgi:uncharacterized protein YciI
VYYILFYEVIGDHVTRRAPYREEHLRLLNEAHERGELVMAGALSEPVDGAVLIFCADDATVPRRFAQLRPDILENRLHTRLIGGAEWIRTLGSFCFSARTANFVDFPFFREGTR